MSRSKHTEAQMIGALKQIEAGRSPEDVAREQGVSKHTIYAWKAKYGGLEVSEAEKIKHLRDENAQAEGLELEDGIITPAGDRPSASSPSRRLKPVKRVPHSSLVLA